MRNTAVALKSSAYEQPIFKLLHKCSDLSDFYSINDVRQQVSRVERKLLKFYEAINSKPIAVTSDVKL